MATKRPCDINPRKLTNSEKQMLEEEKLDEMDDDLYPLGDGTVTTYHEFDEFDDGSPWYKNPPKEVADFMSEEELAEIAALPDVES